jgi:uncharacterized protein (TIGR03083 family)
MKTLAEVTNSIDVGGAYRGVRERLTPMLAALDPAQWETVVPHCPAWTVRQMLAHLVGVVDDAVHGNLGGVGTDAWTKVHVDKRADVSGPQLLDDWNTYAPFIEARFSEVGLGLAQGVFDVVTHEHDLRFALSAPGGRDSEAVWVGIQFISDRIATREQINMKLDGVAIRPVLNETDSSNTTDGAPGTAPLVLTATAFDALRIFSSRRTEAEIRSLQWSEDPSRVLTALPFVLPQSALHE